MFLAFEGIDCCSGACVESPPDGCDSRTVVRRKEGDSSISVLIKFCIFLFYFLSQPEKFDLLTEGRSPGLMGFGDCRPSTIFCAVQD